MKRAGEQRVFVQRSRPQLRKTLRPQLETHPMQTGVGHDGVFSGRKCKQQIYPRVRELIHASES